MRHHAISSDTTHETINNTDHETINKTINANEDNKVNNKIQDKKFTWEELAKHNTRSDAYVAIRGNVYDITSFIARHPGGEDILLFAAGRDATQVFFFCLFFIFFVFFKKKGK